MTKTVCDICGKEMPLEIYVKPIKDYKFCISSYGTAWDICSECRNELDKLIKKLKVESEKK